MSAEYEAVGFYLSGHPLDAHLQRCKSLGVVEWANVLEMRGSGAVKMAGIVTGRRFTVSGRGNRMAFVALSDRSGAYEVTLFQETLANARDLLEAGQPLLMDVEVQRRGDSGDGDLRLTAQSVKLLSEVSLRSAPTRRPQASSGGGRVDVASPPAGNAVAPCEAVCGYKIRITDASRLAELAALLRRQARPAADGAWMRLSFPAAPASDEVEMELPQRYSPDPALKQALEGLSCVRGVEETRRGAA